MTSRSKMLQGQLCLLLLLCMLADVESMFYIRNSNENRYVLDLADGNPCADARVIMCPFLNRPSQFWEFYNNTMIRNVYSGYFLDLKGDGGMGSNVIVWPGHGGRNQQWVHQMDKTVRNGNGLFLDVADRDHGPGAQVIGYSYQNKENQWFEFVHV